ncbi:MAG TPA: CoA-acylating methylmalonate-semialdehyde dehydrogenase [Mycobacteriales bacterium]|nr:CoA-acylating methylmalonate-semialdehyde dehydrogenase [Mycobacteriales bacterium]
MRTIEHWIGGAFTAGGSTRHAPVYNPATGQQQATVALAEPSDVDNAVTAARKGFQEWRDVPLTKRTRIMFAFRELLAKRTMELAAILAAEHGKVVDDAAGEITRGLEVVEFACGIPQLLKGEYSEQVSSGVDSYSFRQPLGVVAGITPFNFPAMVPMWMHPIAIAAGNAFVLKPSERDPSASNFVAELYAEAGLPDGVYNVVHGDKVAVDAILDHPGIAAVSFVGSTPIARYVYERGTSAGKRVQALGGAKNHAVVLPDADPNYAADQIAAAAYGSSGQRCMAISAVVAVGEAADPLVAGLARRAASIRVGPGQDETAEMGPVVTGEALARITGYVQQGTDAGAELVVDGRDPTIPDHPDGFFVGPCLFDRVTPEMSIYTDEIFGPVLVVLRVDTAEEALDLVNANPYGNGTAIFTASGEAARAFQRDVQVGMVGVNVPVPVPMAFYSFGGWKASLFGDTHVHGVEGVRFYTRGKVVTSRWPHVATAPAAVLHFPTAQ